MTMKARYTVVNGEVIAEKRSGVRRLYVPDPLGSTAALLDNTQVQTDTFTYWPYGQEKSRTGTTATPFRHVGTAGYYRDSSSKSYARARVLDTANGRWMTQDPIGFSGGDINLYRYVLNSPMLYIDPEGLFCIKVGGDCVGNSCHGDPDCPPVDRPGHFTCNTGFNHGCCGPFAYDTSPNDPGDCISKACCIHDNCLATWGQFIIPFRRLRCDMALCRAALICMNSGSPGSANPGLSGQIAGEVAGWMCNPLLGTIPLLGPVF